MMTMDRLNIIIQERAEEYHAKAKDYLSSHQLGNFRKCPLLYYKKKKGLIKDADSTAYLLGRAAHTLILEGRKVFEEEYITELPINPKTNQPFGSRTKTYQEWASKQEKDILNEEQIQLVEQMNESVHSNDEAKDLLSEGTPEGVVRAEYCGRMCQIRMDWLNPSVGIVDLKTCDDLTWFENDIRKYGYVHQMAFYRGILEEVVERKVPVYIIAVEKREPFRCGVWELTKEVLDLAEFENVDAIKSLAKCEETNCWPTGYEMIRQLDWI